MSDITGAAGPRIQISEAESPNEEKQTEGRQVPTIQQPTWASAVIPYCGRHTLYTPQLHTTHTAQHANAIAHTAHPARRAKHTHTTPCVSHDAHRQTRACNTRTLKSDLSELKDYRLSLRTVSPLNDRVLGGNV